MLAEMASRPTVLGFERKQKMQSRLGNSYPLWDRSWKYVGYTHSLDTSADTAVLRSRQRSRL